jgi:hypothetical protein
LGELVAYFGQLVDNSMSEYAVVKSFLSCISSSFAFSASSGSERARHLGLILENIEQAIEHQGLSPTTQNLLYNVLEHLRNFEAAAIDSTELDFLIDGAARDNWSGSEDCGIRVFVRQPSVSLHYESQSVCSCNQLVVYLGTINGVNNM